MAFPHRYYGQQKTRLSIGLPGPAYTSAVEEKLRLGGHRPPGPWFVRVSIPIPGVPRRAISVWIPNPRLGRRRGAFVLFAVLVMVIYAIFHPRPKDDYKPWTPPSWPTESTKRNSVVYKPEDLQRIWEWEIQSGHYPSRRKLPDSLRFVEPPANPALPPSRKSPGSLVSYSPMTNGIGPRRVYLDIQSRPPDISYPPRPVPGSIADLDVIMDNCDFDKKKYVRDCLEVLRVGAGLDNGKRVRRGTMDDWKYVFLEEGEISPTVPPRHATTPAFDDDTTASREWETLTLPPPAQYRPYSTLETPCDPENPRIFHMFWAGPITDKPYMVLLSFLFTQNTGLYVKNYPETSACRAQFWLWVNPGPAAAVPNPSALHDMFEELKSNPWASPFLHPRFKDVIQFKLWNTTEQLDGVPELKNEWRSMETLFKSGAHVVHVPQEESQASANTTASATKKAAGDPMINRLGSKSSSEYDRLSVILSDMARFILCHRFGGVYLDADTILLRDWEELFGWKGAFAYRWSRLPNYNTAVLHMSKGSALGTFLFRMALNNGLDFHPMTITKYMNEAAMNGLLLRLPDALFDSAWLNTEEFQRDRPPQPYFTEFSDFFETPTVSSAAPQALGFEGFFSGAYSYHYHNQWWRPFDPSRNWPDLGPRFKAVEEQARRALNSESLTATSTANEEPWHDKVEEDKRDLDWATVIKRTFESYIRGERPNMYGEWLQW
ncbi:uncharacterized protein ARMOST_19180 [Armillaria ostoyae]|uniref:Glycosyltransferase family 32 protein n=1 Tax=Armillaria ostoyae TaxID=47428 RepID=A0A284S3X7_ARMOS|nr:uncharacterized protein ARMOST_19180 [Armillaria ostoyae]